jgi:hypothetical protein
MNNTIDNLRNTDENAKGGGRVFQWMKDGGKYYAQAGRF